VTSEGMAKPASSRRRGRPRFAALGICSPIARRIEVLEPLKASDAEKSATGG